MLKLKNLSKRGFTLVELMVVITIISILSVAAYKAYDSYIKRANDSVRLQALNQLKGSIETYKSANIAPPINQYGLISAGLMTSLPVDPENKMLYQYNADIRGWNKNYSSQGTPGNGYLVASNTPVNDKEGEQYDGENYKKGKATKSYKTNIKNLKYYGGYIVLGGGDASYLTDNGVNDYSANNKYSGGSTGGPNSAPALCGSTAGGGGNKQIDTYEGDVDAFVKQTSLNIGVTMTNIYGASIPGSICKISIKGDGKGTSVANPAVNIDSITGTEGSSDLYSTNYN